MAKGASQTEAYLAAGYGERGARQNASALMTNHNVKARIVELQERAANRTEVSVASITERLLKIAENGETEAKNPAMLAVARASLMDAAKLNGLIIDKAEVKDVTPIDPAARQAEIDRLLAKRGGHLRAVS